VRSAFRISPPLVAALGIAGAIWIGWVARTTRAQQGIPVSPPAPSSEAVKPAPDTPLPLPGPPTDGGVPAIQESTGPAPTSSKSVALPPADPSVPPESAPPDPAGPGNDDPEKNARAFLEQNRRVAQGELRNLKDEAERLRTRLGKVEAGIRRWEALLAALDNSEMPAAPGAVLPPGADRPTGLTPIGKSKEAIATQGSPPIAPPGEKSPPLTAGPNEPGEARKPADPARTPASDNSPTRPKGSDVDIVPAPPPGPALEPR
jgi:hypothetical protein